MRDISLKELLEAGCHFGHQVTRQNPKAREFIFQAREGIHIIDLVKTREGLESAAAFVKTTASQGGTVVFIGTKRQARGIVQEAVKRIQAAFPQGDTRVFNVIERWVGGTLTNFEEVAKNYKKLKDLRGRLQNEDEKAKYTKKEVGLWEKDRVKLDKFYGGICDLVKLPDAIFVVDTRKEVLAVKEANQTGVAVVGIVDTNADPSIVDYPIPANDDAVGSIELIVNYITDAWIEGSKEKVQSDPSAPLRAGKLKVEGEAVSVSKPRPKRAATTKPKTKTGEEKEVKIGERKPRTTKKTA